MGLHLILPFPLFLHLIFLFGCFYFNLERDYESGDLNGDIGSLRGARFFFDHLIPDLGLYFFRFLDCWFRDFLVDFEEAK